jgi:hypothetical protein
MIMELVPLFSKAGCVYNKKKVGMQGVNEKLWRPGEKEERVRMTSKSLHCYEAHGWTGSKIR